MSEVMESIVNCPCCGEQVSIVMNPYNDDFIKMINSQMPIGKTENFEGESQCKCGKMIISTIHVTAN